MTPRLNDISHFRQPYKNAVFSGFGDAATDAANAALVTPGPDGVKTLVPGAGIGMSALLQQMGAVVLTTAADKEQVMLVPVGPGTQAAMDWVNAQLSKGRSVIVSTNDPGGLAAVLAAGGVQANTQLVLAAVSTHADEVAAAGPTMPGAALLTASKIMLPNGAPGPAAKAGIGGPIAIAAVALLVVGGVYLAFGRKGKHAGHDRYDD